MEEHGKNAPRHKAVDETRDRGPSPGLFIEPPPKETGPEQLYRVVYVIDVNAAGVRDAAKYTHGIMADPTSLAPVLHVLDHRGQEMLVDLADGGRRGTVPIFPLTEIGQTNEFKCTTCGQEWSANYCPECGQTIAAEASAESSVNDNGGNQQKDLVSSISSGSDKKYAVKKPRAWFWRNQRYTVETLIKAVRAGEIGQDWLVCEVHAGLGTRRAADLAQELSEQMRIRVGSGTAASTCDDALEKEVVEETVKKAIGPSINNPRLCLRRRISILFFIGSLSYWVVIALVWGMYVSENDLPRGKRIVVITTNGLIIQRHEFLWFVLERGLVSGDEIRQGRKMWYNGREVRTEVSPLHYLSFSDPTPFVTYLCLVAIMVAGYWAALVTLKMGTLRTMLAIGVLAASLMILAIGYLLVHERGAVSVSNGDSFGSISLETAAEMELCCISSNRAVFSLHGSPRTIVLPKTTDVVKIVMDVVEATCQRVAPPGTVVTSVVPRWGIVGTILYYAVGPQGDVTAVGHLRLDPDGGIEFFRRPAGRIVRAKALIDYPGEVLLTEFRSGPRTIGVYDASTGELIERYHDGLRLEIVPETMAPGASHR